VLLTYFGRLHQSIAKEAPQESSGKVDIHFQFTPFLKSPVAMTHPVLLAYASPNRDSLQVFASTPDDF
jgi:hypothetical protein